MRAPSNPYEFEAQIRDTTDHESSTMEDDSGATVVTNDLHPNTLRGYSDVRIYIADSHDQGFDVDLQHTRPGDDGFADANTANTVSLAAGDDVATVTLEQPVGRFQFVVRTGALSTAPASGSIRVYVVVRA